MRRPAALANQRLAVEPLKLEVGQITEVVSVTAVGESLKTTTTLRPNAGPGSRAKESSSPRAARCATTTSRSNSGTMVEDTVAAGASPLRNRASRISACPHPRSSGVPVGTVRAIDELMSKLARAALSMSLFTGPGYTVTMWTPCGATSARSPSEAAASAPFDAL